MRGEKCDKVRVTIKGDSVACEGVMCEGVMCEGVM